MSCRCIYESVLFDGNYVKLCLGQVCCLVVTLVYMHQGECGEGGGWRMADAVDDSDRRLVAVHSTSGSQPGHHCQISVATGTDQWLLAVNMT